MKQEASDRRVVKLLHFLLENTVFQDLLRDLGINVLYVEEGVGPSGATEELQPKCLFTASSVEEGLRLAARMQPHIILLNIPMERARQFAEQAADADARIIVICPEEQSPVVWDLLLLGIRHFILPPVTPVRVLQAVQESLYELSLKNEVTRQRDMVRAVLEFQTDLLVILEDDQVIDCNTTFLQFFGYEDLLSYQEEVMNLADFFMEEKDYYWPLNKMMWVDDCIHVPKKVKMKNQEGKERVFFVRASQLPDDVSRFMVMCTDITDLEAEYKEKERLAITDSLTNVYNQFKFQALLGEQWEKAYYGYDTFSVLMFDIDKFQAINDTYGYDYGDLVLVQLADVTKKQAGKYDMLARWSGGTFVLLLPHLTSNQAFQVAESLRFCIETKKFTGIPVVTASFGVAQYEPGLARERIIQRAQQALQEAKQGGGNQVRLFHKGKKK